MSVNINRCDWVGRWPFVVENVTLERRYKSIVVVINGVRRALNGMAYHTERLAFPTVSTEQLDGVDMGPMIRFGMTIEEGE
jgi:hypothetical protein